jgi:phosphohistidine swiveling domain-containing protein
MTVTEHRLGPGTWEIDATHFPRPPSPILRKLYTTTFVDALAIGFERMGVLMETLQFGEHDGFLYTQPRVVGAPRGAAPPPHAVAWLLSRLHPAMRARDRRATAVFTTHAWREDLATFRTEVLPALRARHLALVAVDVGALDRDGLAAHVESAHDALVQAIHNHGRFTVPCQIAPGDFIAQVSEWTGLGPGPLLQLLRGSAPVSAGRSDELDGAVAALRADRAAASRLAIDDDPAATLAALRAWPGAVGAAVGAWIDLVGWRTIAQYDVAEPVALEIPVLLVVALRAAVAGRADVDSPAALVAEVRERVPAAHREAFDVLLEEARAMAPMRDERTLYADSWATGILRRALLEAGRRCPELRAPSDLCSATIEEALAIVRGGPVDAAGLAARADSRKRSFLDVPAVLGPAPRLPPVGAFPAASARSLRAAFAVLDAMFRDSDVASEAGDLRGIPVSAGRYTGVARVVRGPDDFHRLRPGDVLVAPMTSPAFNIVLPMLGAIVTDRGGALSHAAIVAREFGIPGVVGCREGTRKVVDGQRVLVDGAAGIVTLGVA